MSTGTKFGFVNNANVQQVKFTAVKFDASNEGGISTPTKANDGPIAGVLTESLLPYGVYEYKNGVYDTSLNGVAWPSTALDNGVHNVSVQVEGRVQAIKGATGTVAQGDRIATSDATGRMDSIEADGLNLATGTKAYVVGYALTSASTAGDVFKLYVKPEYITV